MKKILVTLALTFMVITIFTVTALAQNEYVFYADEINQNSIVADGGVVPKISKTLVTEDDVTYLRIKTTKVNNSAANSYFRFDIFEDSETPLFNVDEYPFVAISYRTNIAMEVSGIAINAGMKPTDGDSYLRCWGLHKAAVTDGSRALVIYNVKECSGAYEDSSVTYTSIDPAAGIKFIRIPPWAKALDVTTSAISDDYFDIEYIGFFKSDKDAGMYADDNEYTITYYDMNGDVYHTDTEKAYTLYEPIAGPEVEGLKFTGWVNSSKTVAPESFRIDTDYEFYPEYSRSLEYYVYPAGHFHSNTTKMDLQPGIINENGARWSRYVVTEDGVSDNTYAVTIKYGDFILANEFKYVAIKYKSNISTATKSAFGPGLKYTSEDGTSKYYKFWGIYMDFFGDSNEHLMIGCLDSITGGDATGVNSFSQIDSDSGISYLRFAPWGQPNKSTNIYAGEYLDIAYIGFFSSEQDALDFYSNSNITIGHDAFMEFGSDLKFRPDDNLTRGEAVEIITRIIADYDKIKYVYNSEYTDLEKTDDCYSSVAYLERLGYLTANGGSFNADDDISSDDLIELINKAAEDYNELSAAESTQVSGTYITRGETAELFCKLLGRKPSVEGITYAGVPGPVDVPRENAHYKYIIEACYDHRFMTDWDESELWTFVDENNFYMKKAPDGMIDQLNEALAQRAEAILETESDWTLAPGGKIIYVSNNGSDSNDGLSQSTPIATITRLHELQSDNTIVAGDVVLFERGGEWYPIETLNANGEIIQDKFITKIGVTYSAYGTGDKPRILGSINASGEANWTKVDGYDDLYVFNKKIGDAYDIGNIVFDDGKFTWEDSQPVYENPNGAFGMRLILDPNSDHALQAGHEGDSGTGDFIVSNGPAKWVFNTTDYTFTQSTDLQAIADAIPESDLWYHHNKEESKLYMISKKGNPGKVFEKIDLCTKKNTITAKSDVTLDNLCIKFTGSHGVGAGSCKNLVIRNCEVGWIGGSIQKNELEGETGRFGNAIEIYGKADGFYVYDCYIYQCFDCGPTVQASPDELTWGDYVIEKDVHFYGNALWNAALEVWLTTKQDNFGKYYAALINCKMYDNLVAFNGYGFQGYTHQKHDYCGFYGAGGTRADYIDCTMENNTFWNLRMNILKSTPTSVNDGDGIYWKNNTIVHRYDDYLGLLGNNTKEATGASVRYYYNNDTVKKLINDGAFGHNDFYYTLTDDADDPADNIPVSVNGIVRGDSDGDGEQSPNDLIMFSRYLAKWGGYNDRMYGANSDLNGDGQLTSLDLVILARRLANWVGYND